jgi:hypothetical protein
MSILLYLTKNIRDIFKELHEKINDIVLHDRGRNLYEILLISIQIDYISLQFFYKFIESIKYKSIIDTSIKINSYIYGNIDLYKQNLPFFLSWRKDYVKSNKLSQNNKNTPMRIDEEGLIFDKTLEKFFSEWSTKINGPTGFKEQYKELTKRENKISNLRKGIKLINKSLKPKSLLQHMENYV